MITDKIGNKLYREGDVIYLKLVSQNYRRKLGVIDEQSKIFLTTRVYEKHLYRNAKSFGFNSEFLRSASLFKDVKLLTDRNESFVIPVKTILEEGSYLHFKKQGFERQIFLSLDKMQKYLINE